MPEDEERNGEGEDLFEDLDKFFAPIQDVDWPESSEGKIPGQAAGDQLQSKSPAPGRFRPAPLAHRECFPYVTKSRAAAGRRILRSGPSSLTKRGDGSKTLLKTREV